MSLKLSDYDYPLPNELIAKRPLPRRDESRMMVLHRDSQTIEHQQFRDLKTFLRMGDLIVLNNTRVLAARKFSDDHAVEFLFLEKLGPARWRCLVKPGRKKIVSFASQSLTLLPGDVILTGTPSGVGPIRNGDELEAQIDDWPPLRNRVAAQ